MIGVIYKITNLINNKIYIGLTTQSIQERWKQHIKMAYNIGHRDSQSIFKKAIRKYGEENFLIEIIDTGDTPEELKEKEIYYIKVYNSYAFDEGSHGYNSTRGGDGLVEVGWRAVVACDIIDGKILYHYPNIAIAEREQCRGVFESCHNSDRDFTANGLCYFFEEEIKDLSAEELTDKIHNRFPTLVYQLDLDGHFIKLWRNSQEAVETLGFNSVGNITACCLGQRRIANGYQWAYQKNIKERINQPLRDIKTNAKAIRQYDRNTGELIKIWDSIKEAAQNLNLQESKISSCCSGQRKTTGNYLWRYDIDNLIQIEPHPEKPQIICNETGEIFPDINHAAKFANIAHATCKKSCEGFPIKGIYSFSYIHVRESKL